MMIDEIWRQFQLVASLEFQAVSSDRERGWNGEGKGEVRVESKSDHVLLFHEKGEWTTIHGKTLGFTNTYRWTYKTDTSSLGLEHLRFGDLRPVSLFDLSYEADGGWSSVCPHVCSEDLYTAEMRCGSNQINLDWKVEGPERLDRICYVYHLLER